MGEAFRWRPRQLWYLVRQGVAEWVEDKAPNAAAALAYYTLFAIGPLLVIAVAIAGLVFGAAPVRAAIAERLGDLMGEQAGRTVEALMAAGQSGGRGLIALAFGVVGLLVAAMAAFAQLREALNRMWEVAPKKVSGFWRKVGVALRRNLLSFAGVLGLGFLLLVSLVLSAGVAAAGKWLEHLLPGTALLWTLLNLLIMVAVVASVFVLLFQFLPETHIAWRDCLFGGVFTAILFVLGEFLIGLYLGSAATASRLGAVGAVPILLLWTYYSALIVLLGAEITQVYANQFGAGIRPTSRAQPLEVALAQRHDLPSQEGKRQRRPARGRAESTGRE